MELMQNQNQLSKKVTTTYFSDPTGISSKFTSGLFTVKNFVIRQIRRPLYLKQKQVNIIEHENLPKQFPLKKKKPHSSL